MHNRLNLTLFLFLLSVTNIYSQVEIKTHKIIRTNEKPVIDGLLDEKIWNKANIASNFTELEPNNGKSIPQRLQTEVKSCYDNEAIYFGIYCFDNHPDSILTELSARDEIWKSNSDQFTIMIIILIIIFIMEIT